MSKKILIIDDELDMAEAMATLLQDEGYAAHAVSAGETGLEFMKKELPHLVIMDVMMPTLKGNDVAKAMKDLVELSNVPILLMSASKEPECKPPPPWNKFIRKPFDIDQLISEVRNLVSEAPATSLA